MIESRTPPSILRTTLQKKQSTFLDISIGRSLYIPDYDDNDEIYIYIYYDDNDTIDPNDTIFCFYTLQALSLDFFIVLDKVLARLGLQTFSLYPSTQDSYFLIFIKLLFNVDYSNYANVEH